MHSAEHFFCHPFQRKQSPTVYICARMHGVHACLCWGQGSQEVEKVVQAAVRGAPLATLQYTVRLLVFFEALKPILHEGVRNSEPAATSQARP